MSISAFRQSGILLVFLHFTVCCPLGGILSNDPYRRHVRACPPHPPSPLPSADFKEFIDGGNPLHCLALLAEDAKIGCPANCGHWPRFHCKWDFVPLFAIPDMLCPTSILVLFFPIAWTIPRIYD
jgi:hypothetical protein